MNSPSNILYIKGFVTTQRHLQGQPLQEIEARLGFHGGRLSRGAWFATVLRLPEPEEFEFEGYSQVAGHHTEEIYPGINDPLDHWERQAYIDRKNSVIHTLWSLQGEKRLIKVVPVTGHDPNMDEDEQYPPGSGIPQWKITTEHGIRGRYICFVGDYPNGRFIPDEGYTPVRYF